MKSLLTLTAIACTAGLAVPETASATGPYGYGGYNSFRPSYGLSVRPNYGVGSYYGGYNRGFGSSYYGRGFNSGLYGGRTYGTGLYNRGFGNYGYGRGFNSGFNSGFGTGFGNYGYGRGFNRGGFSLFIR